MKKTENPTQQRKNKIERVIKNLIESGIPQKLTSPKYLSLLLVLSE